jgi:hypothetical protein
MKLSDTPYIALQGRVAVLEKENEALKSKLANGIRVYAYYTEYDDWTCSDRRGLHNATLLLD